MKKLLISTILIILIAIVGQANADIVRLSVSDLAGDQFGPAPDLLGMELTFDNSNGDYEIILQSSYTNPFLGEFRVNINLFNLDLGTSNPNPTFFNDNMRDYNLISPTTSLELSGNNSRLLSWNIGDEILLNNFPTGSPSPDGVTFFRSTILGPEWSSGDPPFSNEDMLGLQSETVVLQPIPIPGTVWLVTSCLIGILGIKRKMRK